MLKMLTVYDKYNLHKKLGHDTYNAFLSRLQEDNPELYEKYINPNPDDLSW